MLLIISGGRAITDAVVVVVGGGVGQLTDISGLKLLQLLIHVHGN